jgi:hypothetical protein
MRTLLCILSSISLAGCSSMGGVLSSETTWFQDWSCERQDGVCARTDTIDAITISELDSDPAEAGPVSGYPVETLPLSATPKKLRGIQPLDQEYFDVEIERGRPFLETSFGEEELTAAPAMLSEPPFSIDAAFDETLDSSGSAADDLFEAAFPEAAIGAQFAVLKSKMRLNVPGTDANLRASNGDEVDGIRVTRTIIRRDGVLVPENERVTELVEGPHGPQKLAVFDGEKIDIPTVLEAPVEEQAPEQEAKFSLFAKTPRRSDAKVLPVIISPYVDARGIFHERSVIWVEVEPADWVVE